MLNYSVIRVVVILALIVSGSLRSAAEEFVVGYLTGSQRRPGDLEYTRPGITISGAISLAVKEVNEGELGRMNHSIRFIVAETFGEEATSIKQTAALWTQNISAYIGPQETCIHEGRMAAAFNLPMISYFCTHYETSDKKDFPTFARTRPPDTQISKSVTSLLLSFNWTHVSFLYLDSPVTEMDKVATTVLSGMRSAGVFVKHVRRWHESYHHGYSKNPFPQLLQDTFRDTRIYVVVGHQNDYLGLMLALDEMELCESGQYFVVGVDIEQYDPTDPNMYLRGLLQKKIDPRAVAAFSCYLGVMPTAPRDHTNFTISVNHYMERPPFNFPNPVKGIGQIKQIRAEAAYLYDAVHLYGRALIETLRAGNDPRHGSAIIAAVKGTHYKSAMGYMVYLDENGDAAGNYTLVALGTFPDKPDIHGLFPVGLFVLGEGETKLPDLRLNSLIRWNGGRPPVAEPRCGFRGEKCISYTGEITGGIAGGALLVLAIVSLVLYRNWKYEQELDSLLWKVDFKEIQLNDEKQSSNEQQQQQQQSVGTKITRAVHPLIRTSQVSLSSNPDADFRYSAIFTQIGLYRGRLLAIKKVRKKSLDISREMKKELKMMRDLRHDNLNTFIGACTESPDICILTEYCTRGSLKDILENEDVKLDNMFIASLVGDIIRGMIYLHESPIRFHGNLCTSNCLVDSRWVLKLTDFGLNLFKHGEEPSPNIKEKCQSLLYRAPELLRVNQLGSLFGTQKGDVYSFSIILYEMHTRRGPFGETDKSTTEILKRVIHPAFTIFRPPLEPLENSFDFVRDCLKEGWSEDPEERPDFKTIRTKLRALRKGMKPNIFDNMMAMMEKYANNLEQLVDERTDQLQEEKKKTDALLFEMLPRPVAEQLKRGNKVEAESFDCVTIYFSDIVGFTAMSAESTPLQVVDFLNDLYTCFDSTIGNYDVYKVETIGDAYMVVSGLPLRNGVLHAGEIATMSLHLLAAVQKISIRHRPDDQLMLRIGIHSGPVCAGVVGLKMPRYCLFGDTVNTASRMESTGLPLKIHCSSDTKALLDKLGGYIFIERGVVPMKGKGEQLTYFLDGEDEIKRALRTEERKVRMGVQPAKSTENGVIAPRSSLKTKSNLPKSPLPRCSSLESPKKLRFASSDMLQFHQYQHYNPRSGRNSILEVIVDNSPCKKSSNSLLEISNDYNDLFRLSSSSCPCIEHLVQNSVNLAQMQLKLMPKCTYDLSVSNSTSTPNLFQNDDDVADLNDVIVSAPVSPTSKITTSTNGFLNLENDLNVDQTTPLLKKVHKSKTDPNVETRV